MPSGKLIKRTKRQTLSDQLGKTQTLSEQFKKTPLSLSWSQYIFLLGVKDADARSFYEIEAANNGCRNYFAQRREYSR